MIEEAHVPVWAADHHDQGELQIDYPDEDGRIEELNELIDAGRARLSPGKYIHAASRSLAHLRGIDEDDE